MPKFNHAFDFAFEVHTDKESDDVTGEELRAALLKRLSSLSDEEMLEACGCYDSLENY